MPNYQGVNPTFTGRGRLQIDALASSIGTPAEGAKIQIMPKGDKDNVIEELISDSSGQTPTLDLPAPPVDFSMDPSGQKPYSEYDINVTMESHETAYVSGIQILADTASYQYVNLNPLPLNNVNETRNTNIVEHTLWETFPPKIPEEDTKPLHESTGFVVLPEPVIPEFIIVHAGAPTNASGNNYWVPFKEYIKNVASCEIYATWPEETIKANVFAIISFTLNRVYTEWYRRQRLQFYNYEFYCL